MGRKYFKYVIPSVLAMWIFSVYTMISGVIVAKGVNELALAALNISIPYVYAAFAVSLLFAVGTSTIASINLGNKETKKASEIFTMSLVIIIIISIVVTAIVLINLDSIAYFLGATTRTISYVIEYLRIVSFFTVFIMVSYYFEVLVKTEGSPKLATIGVCISALTNILIVYILVIKYNVGIKGAAFATGFSHIFATIAYVWHFTRKDSKLKFVLFKFEISLIGKIIPIGLSDFVTEFSAGFITFVFNRTILLNIGDVGIITYTVIMYISNIVIMTMMGISQGTQPLVSYYYGRDDKETYTYFLKTAVKTVAIISIGVYVMCMIFAEQINEIFISKEDSVLFLYSIKAFRTYILSYLVLGFNIVFVGFYAAIEKPLYSMIISTGRGLVVIVASLYFMSSVFGENGIWMASFISETICLIIATIIFIKFFVEDLFVKSNIKNSNWI